MRRSEVHLCPDCEAECDCDEADDCQHDCIDADDFDDQDPDE